ncbi:MAG: ABC transporter ATP-binding protein [Gammaproteobacteria bacterium]|nr:MAG: ABC transporter ATP-binding protein [Gammaproteobacteria bacterium]UCH41988.1 MAG: ABC transporter ATP-binding protein [Gammaproteobacteria bacterium]
MLDSIIQPVISMQNVSKTYGRETVLSDMDLDIQSGECVVLVGHNGAGKTTLMKLMLGLTRPTSGRVEVLGGDPAFASAVAHHRTWGYLPESVAFNEAMTGSEVLTFYARLKGSSPRDCENLLDIVGLSGAAARRVGTYSKGMRQRLGLAQAMLGNPRLLFLDEPTNGLDPSLRHLFYDLINALHRAGATSVISSHALDEIEARANRFVIVKSGRMIASGTLDELFRQAALPVRMRISVAPGQAAGVAERLGSAIDISEIGDTTLSLACFNGDKMAVIRRIGDLGDSVNDLQIQPPKLDEVYNHFMNREAS